MSVAIPRLSFVAFAFCGCAAEEAQPASVGEVPWTKPVEWRAAQPFPRRFRNKVGQEFVIARPPQRIASSTLFTDVVLLACCPKERIAALHEVSEKPRFSPVARASQGFPRHITSDPESVRMVRPDLVFLASFSDKRSEVLVSGAGCTVVRLHQLASIAGVQQSIRNVGWLLGLDRPAEALVTHMQQRLDAVAANKDARAKWRVMSFDSGFVAGKNTIFDDVCEVVGVTNTAAELGLEGTVQVSQEHILAMAPDAVVVGIVAGEAADTKRGLLSRAGMRNLDAMQKDRIVYVPNHLMMSASHHLAGLAEVLAKTLDGWQKP